MVEFSESLRNHLLRTIVHRSIWLLWWFSFIFLSLTMEFDNHFSLLGKLNLRADYETTSNHKQRLPCIHLLVSDRQIYTKTKSHNPNFSRLLTMKCSLLGKEGIRAITNQPQAQTNTSSHEALRSLLLSLRQMSKRQKSNNSKFIRLVLFFLQFSPDCLRWSAWNDTRTTAS